MNLPNSFDLNFILKNQRRKSLEKKFFKQNEEKISTSQLIFQ